MAENKESCHQNRIVVMGIDKEGNKMSIEYQTSFPIIGVCDCGQPARLSNELVRKFCLACTMEIIKNAEKEDCVGKG